MAALPEFVEEASVLPDVPFDVLFGESVLHALIANNMTIANRKALTLFMANLLSI